MRVISGCKKGTKLFSLDSMLTRPTTDRVKESLFSIIQFNIFDSLILDLFGGSGALGIEAISRGAKFCDFVEQSKEAAIIIKKNIEKTDFSEKSSLNIISSEAFLKKCSKKYNIIFMDPPYHHNLCNTSIDLILKNNLLEKDGVIVCETAVDENIDLDSNSKKEYIYGKIKLTIIRGVV